MKKFKRLKIILILLIVISLQLIPYFTNNVQASNSLNQYDYDKIAIVTENNEDIKKGSTIKISLWSDAFDQADSFLETGKSEAEDEDSLAGVEEDGMETAANRIYNLLFGIGVVLTVIVGGVLGIKFMIASAEEKADYKKSLPGYLFGAIMVLAISLIPSVIYQVMQ